MKSKNSKAKSDADAYKKAKALADGGKATNALMAVNAASRTLDAVNPQDTEMKYGSNEYFDKMNNASQGFNTAANVLSAVPGVGGAIGAGLSSYKSIANAIDPKDAYGVSKKGAFSQIAGQYFRPAETYQSIARDFKNDDVSLRTFAKLAFGGGRLINDENAIERAKLKQQYEQNQNQSDYDTQSAIGNAMTNMNVSDAIANRNAGVTGYKTMYNPNPTLKQAELDMPELSGYGKWFEKKGYAKGGSVDGDPKKPIYVTDPNDPRLKAYNDSLSLYNESAKILKKDNVGNSSRNTQLYVKKGTNPNELKSSDYDFVNHQQINTSGDFEENMNPNNVFPEPKNKQKIMPIAGIGVVGLDAMGGWQNIYKKPVQPVVLKKEGVKADYLPPKSIDITGEEELMPQRQQSQIVEPEYQTEIVTTPYQQIKRFKDSTGKFVKEEYYDFNGNRIDTDRYAKGGEIKGKGTAKSDSIKAKVEKGSFVVPAENAEKAKAIKEELLESPADEKAELEHNGGVDVKLSDGEYLFSKEEHEELKKMGIDLYKEFAPNSDDLKGLKDGGLTSEKAKIMLRENQANGQPLSDAQKRYFGWVAGGRKSKGGVVGYKEGGEVNEYANGGEPKNDFVASERKRIEAEKAANIKRMGEVAAKRKYQQDMANLRVQEYNLKKQRESERLSAQKELAKLQAERDDLVNSYNNMREQQNKELNSKQSTVSKYVGASDRISSEQALKRQEDLLNKISEKEKALSDIQAKYDELSGEPAVKTTGKKGVNYFNPEQIDLTTPVAKTPAPVVTNPKPIVNPYKVKPAISANTTPLGQPKVDYTTIETPDVNTGIATDLINSEPVITDASKPYGDKSVLPTPAASTPSPTGTTTVVDPNVPNNGIPAGNKTDWMKLAGNALPYALGAAQTIYGLNQLKKAGDRPVDKLDPDFLAALDKTRGYVTQADLQAKYGYTTEQLAALNMQNVGLTNAARYNARNIAGNNPATALGLERAAANDAYGRALQTRIDDTNLKLGKQQIAADRQNAVNAMTWNKQQQNRQLFLDNLNAWQQKTQAAAALANTGGQNIIDQYNADKRLAAYNQMMKDANKTTN